MKPLRLKLKNFIGIRAGLGRDELEIDFEPILAGNQLVAIVGENGAGKSTLLDNLSPFRVMPSRAGGYNPGSFSYYDNTYGEALKEFDFEQGGRRYRSTLVIKGQNKTKTTQAYLFNLAINGGTVSLTPVKMPDGTDSDGKTATYDRCVEHVCGSSEMFFSAAFSSQGKKPLSAYANGDIKALMSELLGLDHVRDLGKKAGEVVKGLRRELQGMQSDLAAIATKEREIADADASLKTTAVTLKFSEDRRTKARVSVQAATRKLAEVQADNNANAEIEMRRQELSAKVKALSAKLEGTARESAADTASESNRLRGINEQTAREVAGQTNSIGTLRRQIQEQRAISGRAAEVDAAKALAPELEAAIAEVVGDIAKVKGQVDALHALETEKTRLAEEKKSLVSQGQSCAARLKDLRGRAELVTRVPCIGMDIQATCPLLENANEADRSIPDAAVADTANRTSYAALSKKAEDLGRSIEQVGDPRGRLRALETRQTEVLQQIAANNRILALEDAIRNSESVIAQAEASIAELEHSTKERRARQADDIAAIEARIAELKARHEQAGATVRADLAQAQQSLAALPETSDTAAVDAASEALRLADAELSEAETAVERVRAMVAGTNEQIRIIREAIAYAPTKKATAATIETEIAHWMNLTKALGNDGIIALSIDDAGPTLSSLANDLLLSAYGPRFSVSIKTQAEKADGDLKETFDVIVFDAERDDEKSVGVMSGGEKIYINEALTRAIALYQSQMSDRHYECMFADESDGALDPEKKQQFVRMKRKMLELGGHQNEIFISHAPDLWDMADYRINMADYRA